MPAPGDRFELIRQLGEGGMSVVYEALDRQRDTRIALKTLRQLDPRALVRLKSEFRALADLRHRNLIRLDELVELDGRWYIAMELIEGVDLLSYVRPRATSEPVSAHDEEMETYTAETTELDVAGPAARSRATGPLDEDRLRAAMAQLADGIACLHRAGKIHRDLKPSNVLVAPDERVVIIDLGIVADRERAVSLTSERVVGTLAYMAPEQAHGGPLGPAADWYSFGVILYQALGGRLPFPGDRETMERAKLAGGAPPLLDGPADLCRLAERLLHPSPEARPTGDAVALTFAPAATRRARGPRTTGLVGRRRELDALAAALEAARAGVTSAVVVHGASGVGKSTLGRRFLHEAEASGATVLAGRCYERESVSYKAIDDVIDSLAVRLTGDRRVLREAPAGTLERLGRLFPVLSDLTGEPGPIAATADDPHRERTLAFEALRELLCALGASAPVVLGIDDLQWADEDSLLLLDAVLHPPAPPRVLLVATVRTGGDAPLTETALAERLPVATRLLELGPLPAEDARALAGQLLAASGAGGDADALAAEAGGHPLFLETLVHHGRRVDREARARLDDALWAAIAGLDDDARALVELIAVAGGPLPRHVLSAALDVELGALDENVAVLRAARFARSSGARRDDAVEPYHDRVREAVTSRLDGARRVAMHRRLAACLERSDGADPEQLVVHWRAAGEPERARRFALLAAERAAGTLAFDRAARLYALAIELAEPAEEEAAALHAAHADALASAGRGGAAARAYLRAARAPGPDGHRHRRLAAEQFLRAGHFDAGIDALRAVVRTVGLRLPASPLGAVPSLLAARARLAARGLRFDARDEDAIGTDVIERVDAAWSAAIGLAGVDFVRAADYAVRCLLAALAAGEPSRIARSMAMEGLLRSMAGSPTAPRTRTLLDEATRIAREHGAPRSLGYVTAINGFNAFLSGDFATARARCDEAESIFRDQCTGVAWELVNTQMFQLWAAWYQGDVGFLLQAMPVRLRDAELRGDLYAATNLRSGWTIAYWLLRDDVAGAERALRAADAASATTGFHLQHFYTTAARAMLACYRGDCADAMAWIHSRWGRLRRYMLLTNPAVITTMRHLRASACLGAFARAPARRLVRSAARDARRLERSPLAWARALGALARAGCAAARGHSDASPPALRDALHGFEGLGMDLYAAATRWRLAEVRGDASALTAERDRLHTLGVADPDRLVDMLAPIPPHAA